MNNNTTYKDSPLGKIPSDWFKSELGELLETISAPYKLNTNEYLNAGKYPIVDQGKKQITGYTNDESALINNLPVLIFGDHTKEVKLINFPFAVGGDGVKILSSKNIDTRYLKFLLEKSIKRLPNLGYSRHFVELKNLVEIYPNKNEQRVIAEVLGTWDKAITKLQATITQKELRNKWLMQQLLTGKKRLKGFSGEWKEVRMNDVFDRVIRKNTINNTNVVTISAQRGFVRQTDFFNKNIASEITNNYFLVEKGEFCYNKSYSNGYPWGATKRLNNYEKAVVTTLYICFKIKDLKRNSGDFFECFFERNSLDRGLTKIAHEGGRAHGLLNVTPNDFFELKITIPELEEQTAIANVLQTASNEVQLLQKQLDKLREQKKGLMQVLLTGKKRLKI